MTKSTPLGPPPTQGLKPLAVATKSKKGKWIWTPVKQTKEDVKLRRKWQEKMKKADNKDKWRFKWKSES